MNDLTINELGTIKLDGETLLLNGVAIPCGVNNDGDKNTVEMVKRWNSYDKNQELIAKLLDRIESQLALLDVSGKRIERLESENDKQAEQIEIMRDALTEITKLPEVRMDEARHLACRALAQAAKD